VTGWWSLILQNCAPSGTGGLCLVISAGEAMLHRYNDDWVAPLGSVDHGGLDGTAMSLV